MFHVLPVLTVLAALTTVLCALPTPAGALVNFARPYPISADAGADDGVALGPVSGVAGDGAGNWVAVWTDDDTLSGSVGFDLDVLVARSADDGRTWSAPQAIDPAMASDGASDADRDPRVATDGAGTWVAVWSRDSGTTGGPMMSRSTDDGATWSAPAAFGVDGFGAAIAAGPAGVFIVAASSTDPLGGPIGTDPDVLYSVTGDAALSWSAPAALNGDAVGDTFGDVRPSLSYDGTSRWLAAWATEQSSVRHAYSDDDGATWSAPTTAPFTLRSSDIAPALAGDGSGAWIVAATSIGTGGRVISVARSTDDGLTFVDAAELPVSERLPPGDDTYPHLVTDGAGVWYLMWTRESDDLSGTIGLDRDPLVVRSTDAGATWTGIAALLPNAVTDLDKHGDSLGAVASDGAGNWVALVHSSHDVDGDTGDDEDLYVATSHRDCPPVVRTGCRGPAKPRKSRLIIKNGKGGHDKLTLKLKGLEATVAADFGTPLTTTGYATCLYHVGASPAVPLFEQDTRGGLDCGRFPCWRRSGSNYQYSDAERIQGAPRRFSLRAGAAGKASLLLGAQGALTSLPRQPLPTTPLFSLLAQVVNTESGLCWEAAFSEFKKNDLKKLKAKAD